MEAKQRHNVDLQFHTVNALFFSSKPRRILLENVHIQSQHTWSCQYSFSGCPSLIIMLLSVISNLFIPVMRVKDNHRDVSSNNQRGKLMAERRGLHIKLKLISLMASQTVE